MEFEQRVEGQEALCLLPSKVPTPCFAGKIWLCGFNPEFGNVCPDGRNSALHSTLHGTKVR
jgi:hypothetical protein